MSWFSVWCRFYYFIYSARHHFSIQYDSDYELNCRAIIVYKFLLFFQTDIRISATWHLNLIVKKALSILFMSESPWSWQRPLHLDIFLHKMMMRGFMTFLNNEVTKEKDYGGGSLVRAVHLVSTWHDWSLSTQAVINLIFFRRESLIISMMRRKYFVVYNQLVNGWRFSRGREKDDLIIAHRTHNNEYTRGCVARTPCDIFPLVLHHKSLLGHVKDLLVFVDPDVMVRDCHFLEDHLFGILEEGIWPPHLI